MTDLHDEIRTRLKKKQGRGRIIGDLLDDKNYAHLGLGVLGDAYDQVMAEPAVQAVISGIYVGRDSTTAALGQAAADYLRAVRMPVVVQDALRWTQPTYSCAITDGSALAWKSAWQAVPWHDGKKPLRKSPPVDGIALDALLSSSPKAVSGGAGLTPAGWVSEVGLHGGYYCTETIETEAVFAPQIDIWEGLFKDFPLVDPDAQRRILSALLTAVCLPAISGPIPAYLISAHNPGDGKTLIARIIMMIADGFESVVPWHDDEDRTRELLLNALDSPARVVILDNVRGRLGGSILETILTATAIVGSRKYEKARTFDARKLIIITGNDPRVTPDMARRVVRIQVDRGGQLPPADLPDVLDLAKVERGKWMSCLKTMLDRWDKVRRPIHGCRSYEAWSGLIGGVLGDDWTPIDAARVAAEHDPDALVWLPVLEAIADRQGSDAGSASEILAATGRACWDGLLRGGRGTIEMQIGQALAGAAGRAIGHYRIVREDVQVYTSNGYEPRKKYKVIRQDEVSVSVPTVTTSDDVPF